MTVPSAVTFKVNVLSTGSTVGVVLKIKTMWQSVLTTCQHVTESYLVLQKTTASSRETLQNTFLL